MKQKLSNPAPYPDKNITPKEKPGHIIGVIVLLVFVGAILYLFTKGLPSILKVIGMFLETAANLFGL